MFADIMKVENGIDMKVGSLDIAPYLVDGDRSQSELEAIADGHYRPIERDLITDEVMDEDSWIAPRDDQQVREYAASIL